MIHFELLVEDSSGKIAIEAILSKIEGDFTHRVKSYRGIGRIPPGLRPGSDAKKRILLDQIPRLAAGYGRAFANDPPEYKRVIIVVCDLDTRDKKSFLTEIRAAIDASQPSPFYYVCLAIEEGEAWLLGDRDAVLAAYPRANSAVLASYAYDSICGTWEKLADAIYPGGSRQLKKLHFSEIGKQKAMWAGQIGAQIDLNRNQSESFQYFLSKLRHEIAEDGQ